MDSQKLSEVRCLLKLLLKSSQTIIYTKWLPQRSQNYPNYPFGAAKHVSNKVLRARWPHKPGENILFSVTNFSWFHLWGKLLITRTFPSDPLATMGVSGPPGEDPGWRLKEHLSETRMGGSLRMHTYATKLKAETSHGACPSSQEHLITRVGGWQVN